MADRYAPVPRPAWTGEPPALTVAACRRAFANTRPFTLGVEEELMLLAPESLELAPAIDAVLDAVSDDPRFRRELRAAQIEIVTPVCEDAAAAERSLVEARRTLIAAARGIAVPAGAGAHPFSSAWGEISSGERYRLIAELHPWASSRVACGLHVHVAVGDPDRALAVFNALRSYIPELAALGANSPFLEGRDTGHCSIRAALNDAFPRAGTPPSFASWDEFVALVDWGRAGGSFPDATFIWWDLRPHPGFGTIEFRMPDSQTPAADAAALAAVAQSLTAWLSARHDAGEQLPVHDAFRIGENSWSALRFGLGGWLLDLDTGEPRPTRDRIAGLLDELEPVAAGLGGSEQMAYARTLLAGNGAERQRYIGARGDLEDVVHWLVAATDPGA